jgi:type II restriction enzyme
MRNFKNLTSTFTPTIFTWSFYCDFAKIEKNTFSVRVALGILGSLIGETDIEEKFISLTYEYPEVRKILPILLAIRDPIKIILNSETKAIEEVGLLFNPGISLDVNMENKMRVFFRESGLREILADRKISNLSDYVFGIETGLDTNARKNRSGTLMENIVEDFVKTYAESKLYRWKSQATAKWINENW